LVVTRGFYSELRVAALDSGALPALEELDLAGIYDISASDEAIDAVYEALARSRAAALAKVAGPLVGRSEVGGGGARIIEFERSE